MLGIEIWKSLQGTDLPYKISNHGRIKVLNYKNTGKEQILKPTLHERYLKINLRCNGKRKSKRIHVLVLEYFVGGKPDPAMEGCHNDGNPLNNHADNLRWDTSSGNKSDRLDHGTDQLGIKNHQAKLTEDEVKYIRDNPRRFTQTQLARKFKVSRATIQDIIYIKTWKHLD
jgi:hypothetical protein